VRRAQQSATERTQRNHENSLRAQRTELTAGISSEKIGTRRDEAGTPIPYDLSLSLSLRQAERRGPRLARDDATRARSHRRENADQRIKESEALGGDASDSGLRPPARTGGNLCARVKNLYASAEGLEERRARASFSLARWFLQRLFRPGSRPSRPRDAPFARHSRQRDPSSSTDLACHDVP